MTAPPGSVKGWLDRLALRARLYDIPEEQAANFRAQQREAVLRITPMAMAIQLACALVVPIALWPHLAHGALLLWAGTVAALAALSLRAWWKSRSAPPRRTASPRALKRVVWHALLLGLTWALLPLMCAGLVDADARYLVGVLVAGMVCAGGFALAAVPVAGTLFVALVAAGAAAGVALHGGALSWVFALQLAGYAAIVIYTVWASARMMAARMVAEAQASHQSEVISLLLRDFEDHATDLLWELDSEHRFVHVSPRLAVALGLGEPELRKQTALPLLEALVPQERDDALALWADLQQKLAQRESFRDQTLIVRTTAGSRWWSLSARQLLDHDGQFRGWRGVASDVTERQQTLQRLHWLAHNDALTGLVNRTQLRALLEGLLTGDPASTRPLTLILLDLDGFKHVNDSQGHATGDQLLQLFGQRLLAAARRSDVVARLGGDEFAVLLHGAPDAAALTQLLERLLNQLAEPCRVDGQLFSLRASLGVALAPADGCDADNLMNHADIAMYAAKHAGGHQYCFFNPSLAESGRRRVAMTQALRGALERDEFRLLYQPQVSTSDWRVSGFEALIRWRSPEYGNVSPVDFVPLAEAAGLMPAIGDWVMAQACKAALAWPGAPQISINVSAKQLDRPEFVTRMAELAAPLAPEQVELEITESTLINDAEAAVAILRSLRDHGLRIALDDFGTGYSALGYLRRFPFDTLKIDRSFVKDMTRDGEAQVLVDAIVAMAQALGMATVAEGVEDAAEAGLLQAKGCETLQGYLFSRPLEADQVLPFLANWQQEAQPRWRSALPGHDA